MRDFVDHGLHQPHAVLSQKGREQRVGQPAEGAEGGGGAQIRVVMSRLELAPLLLRRRTAEEAFVGHTPDDGKPPGVGGQAVDGACREHQGQGIAADVGVGGVTVADVEAQFALGEPSRLHDELQLGPGLQVDPGVVEDLGDGTPLRQNSRLLPGGA